LKTISKVRIKYSKSESVRFLSHLEVISSIRQSVRRANLPVCFSCGFSPQLKISFGPPLAVSYTSSCEIFDMEIMCRVVPEEIKDILLKNMPSAFSVLDVSLIPVTTKSIESVVNVSKYSIWFSDISVNKSNILKNIQNFLEAKEFLIERLTNKSKREIDVKPLMIDIKYFNEKIEMLLRFGPKKTVKPDVIIQKIFGLSDNEKILLKINRDEFFHETENGDLIKQ
jgi:radical SAM-linked protein